MKWAGLETPKCVTVHQRVKVIVSEFIAIFEVVPKSEASVWYQWNFLSQEC